VYLLFACVNRSALEEVYISKSVKGEPPPRGAAGGRGAGAGRPASLMTGVFTFLGELGMLRYQLPFGSFRPRRSFALPDKTEGDTSAEHHLLHTRLTRARAYRRFASVCYPLLSCSRSISTTDVVFTCHGCDPGANSRAR